MALETLAHCLNDKKALLENLLACTRAQAGFLAECDVESFGGSVEKRQEIIARIDAVDERIAQAQGDPKSGDAAAMRAAISALLGEIRALDDANLKAAEALKADLAAGVRSSRAQKNLLSYAEQPVRTNRYLNRKG